MSKIEEEDLVNNPTTRLPICLCLDTSYSMNRVEGGRPTGRTEFRDGQMWNIVEGGTPAIEELKEGIKHFFEAIKSDDIAKYSAEIAIVIFNDKAEVLLGFSNIERQKVPNLEADSDSTVMGKGVDLALDILEKRKKEYSDKGLTYYQPWLVLMTDGEPTDDVSTAVKRVQDLTNNKKLTVFAVSVGHESDKETLRKFSKTGQVLEVKSAEYFRDFFRWLSQSVTVASQSTPGEKVNLPKPPPEIEIDL